MEIKIIETNVTVSVDLDDEYTSCEEALIGAIRAIGLLYPNMEKAFYHVDPDTKAVCDKGDVLFDLFLKYGPDVRNHIAERE